METGEYGKTCLKNTKENNQKIVEESIPVYKKQTSDQKSYYKVNPGHHVKV
jgi:hypothetical protein